MTRRRPECPTISLLVTDLDNTLWDWFRAWHASFSAMLARLSALSGVPKARLEQEIREVHRARGTTEYSWLLNELPSLRRLHPDGDPLAIYDEAVHVLNAERRRSTTLYPGVEQVLQELDARGVPVVGYTESIAFWTEWRIKATGLDGLITVLYSSPDHDFPAGVTPQDLRTLPPQEYGLTLTEHRHVPRGVLKPDGRILRSILSDFDVAPSSVVYVGDSLMKDVAMAQAVGVRDVHAQYGVPYGSADYDLLRRVSHWRDEDIERERRLATAPDVVPTYRLVDTFAELLDIFEFTRSGDGR